jgi:hypothetical protein
MIRGAALKHGRAKTAGKILGIIFLLFICGEIASRLYLHKTFGAWGFQKQSIEKHFYPNLNKNYSYDNDRINLLVLGGSVMYEDTLKGSWNEKPFAKTFCGAPSLWDTKKLNVLNLSSTGYTSLDSRYQLDAVIQGGHSFDAVFIYHGINDSRTNNTTKEVFDSLYRHIEFYDDYAFVKNHSTYYRVSLPFVLQWVGHQQRNANKQYLPKEFFWGLLQGNPEPFLLEGSDVKSEKSFRANYIAMIDLAIANNIVPILSTYAFYHAPSYNRAAFEQGELDYADSVFVTELYGLPENVVQGIEQHNKVIRSLADKYKDNVIFFDFADSLHRSSNTFNDICHLTNQGCNQLIDKVEKLLSQRFLHE